MDLFHAVTQSIDQVLTCHWFEGFESLNMDNGKSKTMNTERGGEQTQYVVIHFHRSVLFYSIVGVNMCQVRVNQDSHRRS
jgi:hypothetical protein